MQHYLLFYEKVPNHAALEPPLQAAHLAHVLGALKHGLILAGSLADPSDGAAVLLFKADSPAAIEAFARADPYVTGGVISQWRLRRWETIVGANA